MGHRKKKANFGSVMKDIGHTFQSIEKPIAHVADKLIDTESKLVSKGLDIGGSLALPLMIVGGVVLFVYLKNK